MIANSDFKDKSVSSCFDEALSAFDELSSCELPTNCSDVQYKVKKCMNLLENITRMVSATGLFSSNESVSEVATVDLKLLLLPALLGTLMLKLTSGNRKDIVLTAEVYFKDFLQRCKDYGLTDVEIVTNEEDDDSKLVTPSPPTEHAACGSIQNLMSMARRRATKIQQFHEEKELASQLQLLKEQFDSPIVDDEIKRNYFIALIKSYINKAIDELDCLQSEKSILTHKQNDSFENDKLLKRPYRSKPLQPVIITRDEIQKKVYGAGYPSLPTLTVNELCEKRVQEGTWLMPDKSSPMLDMEKNEELKIIQAQLDEINKESAIEDDNPEYIDQTRRMDEYKDSHKRGWGNRYNRS